MKKRYINKKIIGSGQFSTVYKYYDIIDKKHVAVKKINNDVSIDLIENEINILRMWKHKNILSYINILECKSLKIKIIT